MKKFTVITSLLLLLAGCTKNKCLIVLDANHNELCAKCFHTIDERTVWMQANASKTPEEQCK